MHLVPHVVPRRSVGSSRMLLLAVNFALALATASACDSGTTDDGTGTGTAAQGSSLSLMSNGKVIATSWAIPLNAPNNKLALFSEQREPFTVNNMTGKTVTVKAVTLTPVADGGPPGAAAEEWSLQKYDSKILPIDAAGATIATGKSYDFYVRFYPVVGLQRKATLKIETDGGNFEIALSGSGAPDSTWPVGTVTQAPWALGTADKDELTGTMVAADASSHYISANVDFSTNEGVLITKVSNGGTVAWSRFWNGEFKDRARDPGQNAETGGSAGSLSVDSAGNLYAVASVSMSKANSAYNGGITKVGPDGNQAWSKLFGYGPIKTASMSTEFYAVDASGPVVYAAGTCGDPKNAIGGEGLALFVALDPKDGSVKAKKGFDFTPTTNDRIYAVRGDGKGSAWIGGIGGAGAFFAKIKNADTAPEVEWVKKAGLGVGGNINCLDIDAAGNLYTGLDIRGSLTALAFGKFAPDGKVLWAKQVEGGSGDKNNVHVVRLFDGKLWVGGRIFTPGFDGQMGDGWMGRVATDGTLEWSSYHFSGKGPDELAEHRVKGIVVSGKNVNALSQVYTGNMNGVRYAGYWYAGSAGLAALDVTVEDLKGGTDKSYPLENGATTDIGAAMEWKEPPKAVPYQLSASKKDGAAPDSDMMVSPMVVD